MFVGVGLVMAYLWVAHLEHNKIGAWLSSLAALVNVTVALTAALLVSLAVAYFLRVAL